MSWTCRRLRTALRRGEQATPRLASHAAGCAECGEMLRAFEAISREAAGLQRSWDSPQLWPRIRESLASAPAAPAAAEPSSETAAGWRLLPAAAVVFLVLLSSVGLWVFRNAPARELIPPAGSREPLLNEQALDDSERAEASYVLAIETLARLAEPSLRAPNDSLLVNYREKLMILDSAITDLRAQLEDNRFNNHLRRELLAVYQEKQRTLEQVVREVRS
jgi:hypothetical protein